MHVVFEPYTELAANVDARLVAETHPRLGAKRSLPSEHVVLHQVWPFVTVHADAVSEAVGEVFETGTVTGLDDDVARRGVDRFERGAGLRRYQRGVLGVADDVEDFVHLVCR